MCRDPEDHSFPEDFEDRYFLPLPKRLNGDHLNRCPLMLTASLLPAHRSVGDGPKEYEEPEDLRAPLVHAFLLRLRQGFHESLRFLEPLRFHESLRFLFASGLRRDSDEDQNESKEEALPLQRLHASL